MSGENLSGMFVLTVKWLYDDTVWLYAPFTADFESLPFCSFSFTFCFSLFCVFYTGDLRNPPPCPMLATRCCSVHTEASCSPTTRSLTERHNSEFCLHVPKLSCVLLLNLGVCRSYRGVHCITFPAVYSWPKRVVVFLFGNVRELHTISTLIGSRDQRSFRLSLQDGQLEVSMQLTNHNAWLMAQALPCCHSSAVGLFVFLAVLTKMILLVVSHSVALLWPSEWDVISRLFIVDQPISIHCLKRTTPSGSTTQYTTQPGKSPKWGEVCGEEGWANWREELNSTVIFLMII